MTNSTAAQPLDLDTDTLWYIHGVVKNLGAIELAHKIADAIAGRAALIAQARAAQPESATGTTGASVPTWQERIAHHPDRTAAEFVDEAKDAEIADLRAQLAANGQGEMVQVGHMRLLENGTKMGIGFDKLDEPLIEGWRQIPVFAHLSAPASAQPAELTVLLGRMRDALPACQDDSPDDSRELWSIYGEMRKLASAQPDRGAVVPDGFVWPEPPPSKGQSHVLFEDGYAEGWAKAIDTVRSRLAAAPSPASQPVAQDALEEIKCLLAEQYETEIQRLKDIIKASPISAVAPSDAKDAAGWMVPLSKDGESVWIEGEGDVSLCRCTATSAADAKGKADAANAGGMTMEEMRDKAWSDSSKSINSQYGVSWIAPMPKPFAEWFAAGWNAKSPATSAADAKDEVRLDHMEAWLSKSGARGFKWNSYDFVTGKSVREQLDAAMAAAPSSEKGGAK